jgi:hypothetical protein
VALWVRQVGVSFFLGGGMRGFSVGGLIFLLNTMGLHLVPACLRGAVDAEEGKGFSHN